MNHFLRCEVCGAREELEGWNGSYPEALAPELAKVMPALLMLSAVGDYFGMVNVDIGPGYHIPVDFIRTHREHALSGKGAILVEKPNGDALAPAMAIDLVTLARDEVRAELLAHMEATRADHPDEAAVIERVVAKVFGSLQ